MPSINAAGLTLIEDFESCQLSAYKDTGGVWTIGYGHTPATEGQTITPTEAQAFLAQDVEDAEMSVVGAIDVVLTPNEFSALVSFEFNTGALSSSPGRDLINENKFQEAWDDHFCLYIHDANGNTLEGLVRRRAAERALFFA